MGSTRNFFVLMLIFVPLAGGMSLSAFGETVQFNDVFTLRDDGNNGTIDEIADTPPIIGVPSIWGSVDKTPDMTTKTFIEFDVRNSRLASRAVLRLTISNNGTDFGTAQVKLGAYSGTGSTNLSLFAKPGSFLRSLDIPLAAPGTFCCNLEVDVTNFYNGFLASGTPFLGFSLYDPQWASDPSKGQVFFTNASLEITPTDGIPVTIDLGVGNDKNKINPKSNGILSVAILSTERFDPTTVDVRTVKVGSLQTQSSPLSAVLADVNRDGKPDLLLYFHTQAITMQCGDESVILIGQTLDGTLIAGYDRVETNGCQ